MTHDSTGGLASQSFAGHLDADSARRYVDGTLAEPAALAVDSHVERCAECRGAVAAAVRRSPGQERLDLLWQEVEAATVPPASWLVRSLVRLGVPEPTARLVAAAPSLRAPYLLASVLVGVAAVLVAASGTHDPLSRAVLLLLAPLLPLAAVAGAYGSGDPAHELATAAPVDDLRLALLRTAAVLALVVAPVAVVGGLVLRDALAVAWLLPGVAFVAVVLAASRWVAVVRAAVGVGVVWAVAVGVATRVGDAGDLVGPAGQITAALVVVASAVLLRASPGRATAS